jgi:MFS family permease
MTPWAGPVADRFDRRRIMVIVSGLQAVAALSFLLIGPGRVWVAFAAAGLLAALAAFFGPASQAALPNLVPLEDIPVATAIMGSTWGAMLAVGAGLGGLFTVLFGRTAAFVFDAGTFAVAGLMVATITGRTRADGAARRDRMRPLADTRDALRFARRDPTLLVLLCSKAGFGIGSGVVGLLAVLATDRFNAGDGGTGLLLAARGIGAVSGPLLATRLLHADNVRAIFRFCGLSAIVYGLAYSVVAWSTLLPVTAVFVLIAHLGGGTNWTLSSVGLQLVTPDEYRGRIFAADLALATLTLSLSFFLAGILAESFGPGPVIVGMALVCLAWGAFYLIMLQRLDERLHGRPATEA